MTNWFVRTWNGELDPSFLTVTYEKTGEFSDGGSIYVCRHRYPNASLIVTVLLGMLSLLLWLPYLGLCAWRLAFWEIWLPRNHPWVRQFNRNVQERRDKRNSGTCDFFYY